MSTASELEKLGAHVGHGPAAVVPGFTAEVVPGVEVLNETHIPELGDGQESCGLHLDGDAAFVSPGVNPGRGFPEGSIRGPGRAGSVRDSAFSESGHGRVHH
jgi:hypothetical protein